MASAAFQIEKNFPVPEGAGVGRPRQYPFRDMEVGDSFFIPGSGLDLERKRNSVLGAARAVRPRRFSTRAVDGGIRVWRIA